MQSHVLKALVDELRHLNNSAKLRTDDEAKADEVRSDEICRQLGFQYPDDVFERYGKYGEQIKW